MGRLGARRGGPVGGRGRVAAQVPHGRLVDHEEVVAFARDQELVHHGRGEPRDGAHPRDLRQPLVEQHHVAGAVGRGLVVRVAPGVPVPAEVVRGGRDAAPEARHADVVEHGEPGRRRLRARRVVVGGDQQQAGRAARRLAQHLDVGEVRKPLRSLGAGEVLPVARNVPRRRLLAPPVRRQREQEEHDDQLAGGRAAHEPAVAGDRAAITSARHPPIRSHPSDPAVAGRAPSAW